MTDNIKKGKILDAVKKNISGELMREAYLKAAEQIVLSTLRTNSAEYMRQFYMVAGSVFVVPELMLQFQKQAEAYTTSIMRHQSYLRAVMSLYDTKEIGYKHISLATTLAAVYKAVSDAATKEQVLDEKLLQALNVDTLKEAEGVDAETLDILSCIERIYTNRTDAVDHTNKNGKELITKILGGYGDAVAETAVRLITEWGKPAAKNPQP